MGEEAYKIQDYAHDEAVAFAGALNPKGKLVLMKMKYIHPTVIN